jgi:predicted transcriptional regulator
MDWSKYGYIISSEYRKKIVLSLIKGPMTPKQISLDTKLHLSHVSPILKELVNKRILECLTPNLRKGKIFTLTDEGLQIAKSLKKLTEE